MYIYCNNFWNINDSVTDIESLTHKTQSHLSITRTSATNQLVSRLFSFSPISRQQVLQHGAHWNESRRPIEAFRRLLNVQKRFLNFGNNFFRRWLITKILCKFDQQMRKKKQERINSESHSSNFYFNFFSWTIIEYYVLNLKNWYCAI